MFASVASHIYDSHDVYALQRCFSGQTAMRHVQVRSVIMYVDVRHAEVCCAGVDSQ